MKCYTKRKVVGVTSFEVRSHGNAERGRGRGAGRKSWLLKNVIITLATDPPTPALGLIGHALGRIGSGFVDCPP